MDRGEIGREKNDEGEKQQSVYILSSTRRLKWVGHILGNGGVCGGDLCQGHNTLPHCPNTPLSHKVNKSNDWCFCRAEPQQSLTDF